MSEVVGVPGFLKKWLVWRNNEANKKLLGGTHQWTTVLIHDLIPLPPPLPSTWTEDCYGLGCPLPCKFSGKKRPRFALPWNWLPKIYKLKALDPFLPIFLETRSQYLLENGFQIWVTLPLYLKTLPGLYCGHPKGLYGHIPELSAVCFGRWSQAIS